MTDNPILPACESASTPLPFHTSPTLRILVVDDDEETRRVNTEILLRSGYEVDAAEDGDAAWSAIEINNYDYDLLITDNRMPNLTGVELIYKLRAYRMVLPVIMATGRFPTEVFVGHPWLQPDAMLLKPYTSEELLRTVEKVLRETGIPYVVPQLLLDLERTDNKTTPAGELGGAQP